MMDYLDRIIHTIWLVYEKGGEEIIKLKSKNEPGRGTILTPRMVKGFESSIICHWSAGTSPPPIIPKKEEN